MIQDGSSFALKKALSEVFSGRFTTVEPAAVEVHATYSGFSDEVSAVEIAADSEEERQFLPAPTWASADRRAARFLARRRRAIGRRGAI